MKGYMKDFTNSLDSNLSEFLCTRLFVGTNFLPNVGLFDNLRAYFRENT